MAVETKIKIYKTGKMEAGQFVEDAEQVSMKVNSEVHVSELNEHGTNVKIGADGKITAVEFVEL